MNSIFFNCEYCLMMDADLARFNRMQKIYLTDGISPDGIGLRLGHSNPKDIGFALYVVASQANCPKCKSNGIKTSDQHNEIPIYLLDIEIIY